MERVHRFVLGSQLLENIFQSFHYFSGGKAFITFLQTLKKKTFSLFRRYVSINQHQIIIIVVDEIFSNEKLVKWGNIRHLTIPSVLFKRSLNLAHNRTQLSTRIAFIISIR